MYPNYTILIRNIYLLTFLIGTIGSLSSQSKPPKFTKITGAEGIVFGKINSIVQDEHGFLWLSDQSLRSIFRFDGSHFKQYKSDPNDINSMGGYYPEWLEFDQDGNLWIGYYGQGMDKFNPRTEKFTHFKHDPNNPNSLADNTVSVILEDSKNRVWVGTNGGLSMLDKSTGIFKNFYHNPDDPFSLSHNVVRCIYEDKAGVIWIGTGFAFSLDSAGGLNRYNAETDNFTSYLVQSDGKNGLTHNKIRGILEDNQGNFWIGTGGKTGFHKMDREKGTFSTVPIFPIQSNSDEYNWEWNHITTIKEDPSGIIWVGSESNGIVSYNPESGELNHFFRNNHASLQSGFDDVSAWSIYISDEGLMWVSTQESNFFQADLNSYLIKEKMYEHGAFEFLEDSEGNTWLSSNRGLFQVDSNFNEIRRVEAQIGAPNTLSGNTIWGLAEDNFKNIWISTNNGLNRYNLPSKKFQLYPIESPSTYSPMVFDKIYPHSDSIIWLVPRTRDGLYRFNPLTESFIIYQFDPATENSIPSNSVTDLLILNPDTLFIGHEGDGISIMDIRTETFFQLHPGWIINSFLKYKNEVWISSLYGIYIKKPSSPEFKAISEVYTGLNITEWIKSMVLDHSNNIWAGASSRILKISPEERNLVIYDKSNNVIGASPVFLNYAASTASGNVIFSSDNGLYIIDNQDSQINRDKSNLFLTDFWINYPKDKKIEKLFSDKDLIRQEKINLSFSQNSFGVSIALTDFRNLLNRSISYKLFNYEDFWRQANSGDKLNYYNVPPGNYELIVKSRRKSDGNEIENRIYINIDLPWWKKWWAYLIYLLIFAGIIKFIQVRLKKRIMAIEREKNIQKDLAHSKEIQKAYKELEEAHQNLQSTQAQLIHSEKMASLGELTAGIAHEIQNPLNFVNNFSEVSSELVSETQEEIKKGDIPEAQALLKDLDQNLQKIAHHGKRADSIVKGMLMHSRNSAGEKVATDLNALCDEYLRLSYHGMRAKSRNFNVDFRTDLDPDLPKVKVVQQDMGRVLLNLINNAFHASYAKASANEDDHYKAMVEVSTNNLGDEIQITVSDNGSGIPDNIKDKIFQPFFTTKTTGEGTGLGLSLSYDIVKAHGGEIEVLSETSKGTVFKIILPNTDS